MIDARDGIDATEARAAAKAYFEALPLAEFGGAGPPIRDGEDWLSVAEFGPNLRKRAADAIRISARTGAVSFPGRDSFASVSDLRASAKKSFRCWGDPRLKALERARAQAAGTRP